MPEKKSTPSRVARFLEVYAGCGSVTAAAAAAGIDRKMHYRHLESDAGYRKAFEGLQDRVGQELEDVLIDRAINGTKRQLFWRGKPIKTRNGHLVYEVEYDNNLATVLLKRFRPKLYREHIVQEHTGSVNLVERLEAARARLIAMRKEEEAAGEKSAG
jgi:hypothetical protein